MPGPHPLLRHFLLPLSPEVQTACYPGTQPTTPASSSRLHHDIVPLEGLEALLELIVLNGYKSRL